MKITLDINFITKLTILFVFLLNGTFAMAADLCEDQLPLDKCWTIYDMIKGEKIDPHAQYALEWMFNQGVGSKEAAEASAISLVCRPVYPHRRQEPGHRRYQPRCCHPQYRLSAFQRDDGRCRWRRSFYRPRLQSWIDRRAYRAEWIRGR